MKYEMLSLQAGSTNIGFGDEAADEGLERRALGLFPHFKKHSPLIMDARAFADTKWS